MHIRVLGLKLYGYHGVYESEWEHGGTFEFDIDVEADLAQAVATDSIDKTIDYTLIVNLVSEVNKRRFTLIETLADTIAASIADLFTIERVTVRVRKPGAALGAVAECVEVEASRRKS